MTEPDHTLYDLICWAIREEQGTSNFMVNNMLTALLQVVQSHAPYQREVYDAQGVEIEDSGDWVCWTCTEEFDVNETPAPCLVLLGIGSTLGLCELPIWMRGPSE